MKEEEGEINEAIKLKVFLNYFFSVTHIDGFIIHIFFHPRHFYAKYFAKSAFTRKFSAYLFKLFTKISLIDAPAAARWRLCVTIETNSCSADCDACALQFF